MLLDGVEFEFRACVPVLPTFQKKGRRGTKQIDVGSARIKPACSRVEPDDGRRQVPARK